MQHIIEFATTTVIIIGLTMMLIGCTGKRMHPDEHYPWCQVSKEFCK